MYSLLEASVLCFSKCLFDNVPLRTLCSVPQGKETGLKHANFRVYQFHAQKVQPLLSSLSSPYCISASVTCISHHCSAVHMSALHISSNR